MTLFVNARFLTRPLSGVQRYAAEVVTALDRRLDRDPRLRETLGPVSALYPAAVRARDPGWSHIPVTALSGGSGHAWEQLALARATRTGILLSLCNSGPVLHPLQMLVLHDANIYDVPQAFSRRYRLWHRTIRPVLARRAAALGTVSAYSAAALSRHLGVPADQFAILPNAAGHMARLCADPQVLPRLGLRPGSYWLTVGNASPNKNLPRLVAAHRVLSRSAPPLVVAGGSVPGLAGTSAPAAGEGRVICAGRVSDEALSALYAGAGAFLFPSLNEGFGIPPLEAMQHGVPVLAARSGALPDILGTAPIWFDPRSSDDMIRAMRQLLATSRTKRARMVSAGRAQAARYSWESTANRLVTLLTGLQNQLPDSFVTQTARSG